MDQVKNSTMYYFIENIMIVANKFFVEGVGSLVNKYYLELKIC